MTEQDAGIYPHLELDADPAAVLQLAAAVGTEPGGAVVVADLAIGADAHGVGAGVGVVDEEGPADLTGEGEVDRLGGHRRGREGACDYDCKCLVRWVLRMERKSAGPATGVRAGSGGGTGRTPGRNAERASARTPRRFRLRFRRGSGAGSHSPPGGRGYNDSMAEPTPIPFDTHRFVKRMTEAGMPAVQAEALADEQAALLGSQVATKADFAELAARHDTLATRDDVAEVVGQVEILAARQDTVATKEDFAELAGRLDTVSARQDTLATKEDVAELAGRQDAFATKEDVAELRTDLEVLKAKFGLVVWLISSIGGGVVFLVVRSIWTG